MSDDSKQKMLAYLVKMWELGASNQPFPALPAAFPPVFAEKGREMWSEGRDSRQSAVTGVKLVLGLPDPWRKEEGT